MNLDSVIMITIWVFTLITLLGLLSNVTHPACGQPGNRHGRRCNVHNGPGEWK